MPRGRLPRPRRRRQGAGRTRTPGGSWRDRARPRCASARSSRSSRAVPTTRRRLHRPSARRRRPPASRWRMRRVDGRPQGRPQAKPPDARQRLGLQRGVRPVRSCGQRFHARPSAATIGSPFPVASLGPPLRRTRARCPADFARRPVRTRRARRSNHPSFVHACRPLLWVLGTSCAPTLRPTPRTRVLGRRSLAAPPKGTGAATRRFRGFRRFRRSRQVAAQKVPRRRQQTKHPRRGNARALGEFRVWWELLRKDAGVRECAHASVHGRLPRVPACATSPPDVDLLGSNPRGFGTTKATGWPTGPLHRLAAHTRRILAQRVTAP